MVARSHAFLQAVAATRHDEADFPLAEGGPKARASHRAMPLWFP